MIHDPIIPSAHPELPAPAQAGVEGSQHPLQIPPLAGARLNSPRPTTISQGEDAGAPGRVPPCFPAGGNASEIPAGRATGAGSAGAVDPPALPANPAFVPVAAMEDVLAERRRQIAKFGHTPEADTALPLKQLPREAARFLNAAIEDVQFQHEDWRKHARRHLIRAGALVLAAMDRIEAERVKEEISL